MLASPRHLRRMPRARRAWLHPAGLRLAGSVLAAFSLLLALSSPSAAAASGALQQPTRLGSAGEGVRQIVVKFRPRSASRARAAAAALSGAADHASLGSRTELVPLARGDSLAATLRRMRRRSDVVWAVPDVRAHAAQAPFPNDQGAGSAPGDWQALQWNFGGPFGVNAPQAWANAAADGTPGGRGVVIAVLDTGVAYANHGRFLRSPDFSRFQFVSGHDFIARGQLPEDRNGHGTFVAGTIAEETNNGFGLTGLAYGARIMPVRVLDGEGEGEASTIAEGVRFAVRHGARIVNLSLEFSPYVTASDIPELIDALRYARRHNVLVVAAAGNEAHSAIAYPARAPYVVAVGATTEHGCLADYSNQGAGLTLVAPGGGADATLPGDPNCHPDQPAGGDIYQVTFAGSSPRRFGLPPGYEGTSMAAPHVSAVAALVIASGVLGRNPTPARLTARLRATARKLGGGGDEALYGAGLVDAAAATAAGGPDAVAP